MAVYVPKKFMFCKFWSLVAAPGKKVSLELPCDHCLHLTNACIMDAEDDSPVRLIGEIATIVPGGAEDPKAVESTVQMAFFVPGKTEHVNLNFMITPLNAATLEVRGNAKVHLSGFSLPIGFDYDEEEEEEEEAAKE